MKLPRVDTPHAIGCLGAWMVVTTSLVLVLNLNPARPVARAVILMGSGLVLLWCVLGGLLMRRFRDPIRLFVWRLPGGWPLKFVLFCTLLALLEEAVTVTMTNCAPLFGVPVGKAYITASANYLDVVCFHSVVVFIPLFVGWAWMLGRWDFHPNAVFLLFGLTGTIAESLYGGPQHMMEFGMWVFVYGLMVYLPAYCVPEERGARPPRAWLYPLAVVIPFAAMFVLLPVLLPLGILKSHIHGNVDIHFPKINPNG